MKHISENTVPKFMNLELDTGYFMMFNMVGELNHCHIRGV